MSISSLTDFVKSLRPLSKAELINLEAFKDFFGKKEVSEIKRRVRQKKVSISFRRFGVSEAVGVDSDFPQLILHRSVSDSEREATALFADKINEEVQQKVRKRLYREFSRHTERFHRLIAPHIVGFESVKKAVAAQLFSNEQLHVLLLGDPGTGKTQIIHSAVELAPVSAFGLGSGTTNVGLAVTVRGNKVERGLLAMADQGLCGIDELNLMKKADYASLYNAMEKGFVTYDKGGKHYRFNARVSLLAAANPKGDRFGRIPDTIKSQLPFDSALLTRFHLVFLMRAPTTAEFKEISRRIVQEDKDAVTPEDIGFVRGYVAFARGLDVLFPKIFEKEVVDFSEELKENEKKYLIDVSPRMVVGLVRLAKANARMKLKEEVEREDLRAAINMLRESLNTLSS